MLQRRVLAASAIEALVSEDMAPAGSASSLRMRGHRSGIRDTGDVQTRLKRLDIERWDPHDRGRKDCVSMSISTSTKPRIATFSYAAGTASVVVRRQENRQVKETQSHTTWYSVTLRVEVSSFHLHCALLLWNTVPHFLLFLELLLFNSSGYCKAQISTQEAIRSTWSLKPGLIAKLTRSA